MARLTASALALAAMTGMAFPAVAKPVTDCPNRDAPFSADSPLIDILLNDKAKAVVESEVGMKTSALPPIFASTKPPSFASILTIKQAVGFGGAVDAAKIAKADAALRAIPVTAADKVARCARYDNDVPTFTLPAGRPRILLFEKINGFKDTPSVDAAHAALMAMAQRKGWAMVATDKGGAFNPATLKQFDVVLWNNISGDVLTLSQRKAFQNWMAAGGAYVGVHGSAGDPVYFWDWYTDTLLGARFAGHPMNPQFQEARVVAEPQNNAIAKAIPAEWRMTDEWYSFKNNPRATGASVIATLDESTYKQTGRFGDSLTMGDHPIAWTRCVGKGRMFYSAIGHRPETYAHPNYVAMLESGIHWAASEKTACPAKK